MHGVKKVGLWSKSPQTETSVVVVSKEKREAWGNQGGGEKKTKKLGTSVDYPIRRLKSPQGLENLSQAARKKASMREKGGRTSGFSTLGFVIQKFRKRMGHDSWGWD